MSQMTWNRAIQKVLADAGTPLHYLEITEKILEQKLRDDLGVTPSMTISAQISASINRHGKDSPYRRVARGTYRLAVPGEDATPPRVSPMIRLEEHKDPPAQVLYSADSQPLLTSFGILWRRKHIDWLRTPRLSGSRQGSSPVDFSQQLGIYMLYDGRRILYVGSELSQGLAERLRSHTVDRFATRWDRFSWFGIRPVLGDGSLGPVPASFDSATIIHGLETALIETIEPMQNHRREEGISALEFLQKEDPELFRRRLTSRRAKSGDAGTEQSVPMEEQPQAGPTS